MVTKAGELFRQRITRYVKDGKRVPAGTEGATAVIEESKRWYGRLKDPATGKWVLVALFKDKQASRTEYARREKELERGEVGLVDPFKKYKQMPLAEHIEDHLTDLRNQGRDARYLDQKERLLKAVASGCGAKTVTALTVEKVDRFLTGLPCGARTKNSYRQAIIGLFNFLIKKGRLPKPNPLLDTTRHKGEKKRRRRALPRELLQRLLDAARQRPLLEAMTVRRGPRKGQLGANVRPEVRARLERIGQHRALLYKTAIVTGLRLGTLRQMRICHLNLDAEQPSMSLPGTIMKSGRDFTLQLRPDLVVELKSWVADSGKHDTDFVFDIPPYTQMSKLLKKDLKKAGIPYQDVKGRYFDFHSFRKCTNSFMRQKGVDPGLAKRYLDWVDSRMGLEVYNDEELLDVQEAWDALPELSIR